MPSFQQHAHSYHHYAKVQEHLAQWACQAALPHIQQHPIASTLELGAGTGHLSQLLSPHLAPDYTASDIASNMLAQGRTRLPHVHWQQIDAWQPLHPPVDLICSSSLMQWAPQAETVLRQQQKILKPQGLLFHAFFQQGTLAELYRLGIPSPLPWRSLDQWQAAYHASGIDIITSAEHTHQAHYSNTQQLLRSLHATGTQTKNSLPPSTLRHIIKQYQEKFSDPQGVCATWHFAYILGQKK